MILGEVDPLLHAHLDLAQLLDGLEVGHQAATVGDLDGEARAGVELQQHGAAELVQHHVGADVAQPRHLVAGGRQGQQGVPVGYLEIVEIQACVRVMAQGGAKLHRPQGTAGTQAQTHPHGTLVQVCLAVRGGGGEAHHGHHREPLEDDDPGIGHPFEGVTVEHVVEVDEPFHQRHVRLAAEGIEPRQDVGDMALQILAVAGAAVGLVEEAVFLAQDHQDPLAAGAAGRLDAEARPLLDQLGDAGHVVLLADGADELRHRHPRIQRDALGLELVIHQRVETARVVAADVGVVALVHAEDA